MLQGGSYHDLRVDICVLEDERVPVATVVTVTRKLAHLKREHQILIAEGLRKDFKKVLTDRDPRTFLHYWLSMRKINVLIGIS